jgi:hypothetical protein
MTYEVWFANFDKQTSVKATGADLASVLSTLKASLDANAALATGTAFTVAVSGNTLVITGVAGKDFYTGANILPMTYTSVSGGADIVFSNFTPVVGQEFSIGLSWTAGDGSAKSKIFKATATSTDWSTILSAVQTAVQSETGFGSTTSVSGSRTLQVRTALADLSVTTASVIASKIKSQAEVLTDLSTLVNSESATSHVMSMPPQE